MSAPYDMDALRDALRGSTEEFARELLGEPNQRLSTRRQLRWYPKGGLALELTGAKRGVWIDRGAGGIGGDLLALAQHKRGCAFQDAVHLARAWLGWPAEDARPADPEAQRKAEADAAARKAATELRRAKEAEADAEDEAERQDAARRLFNTAVPVAGTPAETYLVETRRIPRPAAGWPADAMRWHAGVRAWLLAVRDRAGELVAVQRVFLTPDGRKRPDAGGVVKRSLGPVAAGVVRLPGKLPVILAEGGETAAALWSATGHEVWAALGGTGRLTPPAFALLAADDDKRHSPADKARKRAVVRWRRAGLDVQPVHPWTVRQHDGSDFADLIAAKGPEAVRARIALALDAGGSAVRRVPLPIAQVRLDRAVRGFMEAVEGMEPDAVPPVHAVRVDLGTGKSYAVRRELTALVRRLRARGDTRTVVLAVPEHKLSAETEADLVGLAPDLTVRVWHGRKADTPNRPGTMCQDLARVEEVRRLRLDVEEFACRGCPFADKCEYLAQHQARADVWIITAAMLEQRPLKAFGEVAFLVVDEPPRPDLETVRLPEAILTRRDAIKQDTLHELRLRGLRNLVLLVLEGLPDGPLPLAAFVDAGMTAAEARELVDLEWCTLIEPKLPRDASPAQRTAALREAARNADLGRRVTLARALEALLAPNGPEASGRAELRTVNGIRELHLHTCRTMHDGWRVPTVVLDATLRMDVLRQTWPSAELVADVAVEAPHQRVRQVAEDAGFTLSALDADAPGIDAKERKRRERNLARLRVVLHAEARRHTGRVLVVANKRIRLRLEALGMPANVELAHYNKLRGLDRWRDVAALILVGWTLPPAAAMERLAGALTGAAVPATGYERVEARRELADGTFLLSETWQHPDPLVEALRWSACEAELIQAIGRPRGVRRTAANPVDILVLGEAVLPFPVELVPAADPTPDDVQLAHGAVAYAEPAHAARAYPHRYPSANATRMEWARWRTDTYGESSIGKRAPPPGHVRVRYQLAGAGQRPAEAVVDLARCADPRAAVEAAQGILASFELLAPPPAEDTAPLPPRIAELEDVPHLPRPPAAAVQVPVVAGTGPPDPRQRAV